MNNTKLWGKGSGEELESRKGRDEDGRKCLLFSLPGGKKLMPIQQAELDLLIMDLATIFHRLTDLEADALDICSPDWRLPDSERLDGKG